MNTIMTLTCEEFNFTHDFLSIAMEIMAALTLFFFFSRENITLRLRPAILITGIVLALCSYFYTQILQQWNNAFELAGNSYAASGHPFQGTYHYVLWFLTAPLLSLQFLLVLDLPTRLFQRFAIHSGVATVLIIVMCYCAELALIGHHVLLQFLFLTLGIMGFVYLMKIFWKDIPLKLSKEETLLFHFLKIRRFFLFCWLAYPTISILSCLPWSKGPVALIFFTTAYSLADIVVYGGIGWLVYQFALERSRGEAKMNRL